MTKADFLDFVRFDIMPCDVLGALVGPDQTVNVHRRSLYPWVPTMPVNHIAVLCAPFDPRRIHPTSRTFRWEQKTPP